MYAPLFTSELIGLHGQFVFHHHDLCRFHQMYYSEYVRLDSAVAEEAKELHEFGASVREEISRASEEDAEMMNIGLARARESIRAHDLELDGSRAFADQLLVIGLWASVEQFVGSALLASEQLLSRPKKAAPYKWDEMVSRFSDLGLDLSTLKSYGVITECRVLNNKLKHVGEVDKQLAGYSSFSQHLGVLLARVDFPLQMYVDGVFEFVGHVLESMDSLISARNQQESQPTSKLDESS